MQFITGHALISDDELARAAKELQKEILAMNKAAGTAYDDLRGSINLPTDDSMFQEVERVIYEKRKLDPAYIIVVGIGGSNLGTVSVQEAVLGKEYNLLLSSPKFLYADTTDPDALSRIQEIVRPALKMGRQVIVNAISKSGGTTETAANLQVMVQFVKKYSKHYQDSIVITTSIGSKFWKLAEKEGFRTLSIPENVGGRYSVFSPVGLFPLGMLGINIHDLLKGARKARSQGLQAFDKNPAAKSATIQYYHYRKKRNISDMFLFCNDFESIGKWYRQLMGESIGKEHDIHGRQVFRGITPTVSIGSTDLHSMAQLYLGGPYDKYTTFVRLKSFNEKATVPRLAGYETLVENIQGKGYKEIMDAILEGIKTAFQKGKRPFSEIVLPDKSPFSIGQFLQMKMMEMMYLGFLLELNPFDQPNVESYKIVTKEILRR